jgi:hypothetical protein
MEFVLFVYDWGRNKHVVTYDIRKLQGKKADSYLDADRRLT